MKKRKYFIYFLLSFLLILILPTMNAVAESSQTVSSTSVVNIRESPNTNAPIVDQMDINTDYPIIQEQSDWIEITLHTGKTGWVASWLVSKNNSNNNATSNIQSKTGAVTENGLRLRSGPGSNFQVINTLTKGTSVTILSENGDWIEIETNIGTGWVHQEFVEANDKNSSEADNTASNNIATVSESEINVRNSPSTTADIIGKLAKDTIVHIVSQQGNWSKIQYSGNEAWVNSDYLLSENKNEENKEKKIKKKISILYNGTNIRSNATVHSTVKLIANEGDIFQTIAEIGDWYKIELTNGDIGYVANWIVKESSNAKTLHAANVTSKKGDLKNKIIVIDPGHGGKDSGTIGILGTLEKNLTIRTANLLADKLKAAGSQVILTRSNDQFLSLQNRVNLSSSLHADAFISIHYDSVKDPTIKGMTSYYYTSSQKELANELHESIIEATNLTDRGIRKNNYFVLRENSQPATLLELGYLSNAAEEMFVSTQQYQETVSTAIYKGLTNYFK
ncbi:MAG: N-acetylmuramoyl-L-alanine amidase [Bacillus sp. (in: firmicutes)]